MKWRRNKSGSYLLRIDQGEKIRQAVERFCATEGILGASIHGIGAVQDTELGYFFPDKKQYERKIHPGAWELVSFLGNITLKDDKPFLHAHVVMSGRDYQAIGGHLFEAHVSVLCELVISPFAEDLRRVENLSLGAHEWALG